MKYSTLACVIALTLFAAFTSMPIQFAAQEHASTTSETLGMRLATPTVMTAEDWLSENRVGMTPHLQGHCFVSAGVVTDAAFNAPANPQSVLPVQLPLKCCP